MIYESRHGKLGILVGGGPAPGINGVIHAATIEALNNGMEVIGIREGFKHLMEGKVVGQSLTFDDVTRIYSRGGSILYTSRANPTKDDALLRKCGQALIGAGISCLLAIGGDDTAYSAYRVARYADENLGVRIRTAHAPKTIDNDLPLPYDVPTFGFETARDTGARIVLNLMEDALTTQRWYIVIAMGRKAGHLALAIGRSSGATLTLIPEEWRGRQIHFQEVVDVLVASILRRLAEGRRHGVAVVAEGVVEMMDPANFDQLKNAERDEHGHVRLAEINIGDTLRRQVRSDLKKIGIDMRLVSKDVGYELRSCDPSPYDIDYTRSIGQAAADFLIGGGSHATVTIQQGRVVPIPFAEMMDPDTGRTEVRKVDIDSNSYKSAYKLMVRLKEENADDDVLISKMASLTTLTPDELLDRYGYLMGAGERPF
ncbi:MAG: 6-phosphofructokinase [Anaerolineae bacterium]|nr:6-phosphofructokinase [Anaerolineae bacterium]